MTAWARAGADLVKAGVTGGALALQLSPEAALIGFTVGMLLIYLELNRPGLVLPGAAGLLLVLLALGSLLAETRMGAFRLSGGGLVLIGTATALLLLDLLRRTSFIVALAATGALCLGFAHLLASPAPIGGGEASAAAHIAAPVAVLCGLLLGLATAALTRIARRARANKR